MWWQLRWWQDTIPRLFAIFPRLFFLSPTQWNHEQCGHAKAYSTVMLWGNSQESSMPSCQSSLERNINRSTVAIMVTLFFFSQNTLNLTALVVFFSLIIHASSFRILNVCFFYSLVRPYSKTTCRNCLWASCSFCCFPALSVVPGDCLDFADKGTGIRLVGEATLAFCKGIQTKNKRRNKTKEGEKKHTPYRKYEKSGHWQVKEPHFYTSTLNTSERSCTQWDHTP